MPNVNWLRASGRKCFKTIRREREKTSKSFLQCNMVLNCEMWSVPFASEPQKTSAFWISTEAAYFGCTVWFYMTGAVWNCCHVGMLCVHIIQPCNMLHHFMQSHVRRAHACLAVACQLHFGQNDQDLFHATAVTGGLGWNGYWNKSQHGKLTLETKILTPLLQGLEPTTFQSCVRRSNHWAIPVPHQCVVGVYVTLTDHSHIQFPSYQLSQWTHLKHTKKALFFLQAANMQWMCNNDNARKESHELCSSFHFRPFQAHLILRHASIEVGDHSCMSEQHRGVSRFSSRCKYSRTRGE